MGKYTVTHGQCLYDVALHIYGSIEGITDLLINNETLSLSTQLKTGDEIILVYYHLLGLLYKNY